MKHGKGKVSGPGRRTGEGTDSLVRYLQEDLETKPQELPDEKPVRKSIASRMKTALLNLKKK
ncbi:hypothetical protein [Caenimonas soli]|uniref:hypothetical protein n=1 Tax=Caenimonas soli TaxID=2735555 RepID=UPI001552CD37|nr:hypothetical protein [Caenimonas soli]NPC56384.1 hypothetical protein [Caenimonas soli]